MALSECGQYIQGTRDCDSHVGPSNGKASSGLSSKIHMNEKSNSWGLVAGVWEYKLGLVAPTRFGKYLVGAQRT